MASFTQMQKALAAAAAWQTSVGTAVKALASTLSLTGDASSQSGILATLKKATDMARDMSRPVNVVVPEIDLESKCRTIEILRPWHAAGDVVAYLTDPYGSGSTPSIVIAPGQVGLSVTPPAILRASSLLVDGWTGTMTIKWSQAGKTDVNRIYQLQAIGATSPYQVPTAQLYWPSDIYIVDGATYVDIPAILTLPDSTPYPRSLSFLVRNVNGTGPSPIGYGYFDNPVVSNINILPSQGSRYMARIPILQSGKVGKSWTVVLTDCKDVPNPLGNKGGTATCTVHVVASSADIPSGYVAPPTFTNPATATFSPPTSGAQTVVNDFSSLAALTFGEVVLNDQQGLFVDPAITRTVSGATPNCYPYVSGARRLRYVDCRTDNAICTTGDSAGAHLPWASPWMALPVGDHDEEWDEFDHQMPVGVAAIDPTFWMYGRPKEADFRENTNSNTDYIDRCPINFHSNSGNIGGEDQKASYCPWWVGTGDRTKIQIYRRRSTGEFRVWRDGVLVAEGFDYEPTLRGARIFSMEGPGGTVAGTYDPSTDYSDFEMVLYNYKYWGRG